MLTVQLVWPQDLEHTPHSILRFLSSLATLFSLLEPSLLVVNYFQDWIEYLFVMYIQADGVVLIQWCEYLGAKVGKIKYS